MKRERLFYLDLVRAIATILIVITHFNAIYLYTNPQMPEKAVLSTTISNLYIGDFGVTLFLIISGAAMMYTYQDKIDLKVFYKKRFLNLYPMFWIAFFFAFLYQFYTRGGLNPDIPKYRILYSILGMDSYALSCGAPQNFFIVGEWFLGFIVIFYFVFPFLKKCMEKWAVATAVAAVFLYILFVFILKFDQNSILLPVRLLELLFGMYFVKYLNKVSWPAALFSLLVLLANGYLKPDINMNFQVLYVGVSAFLLLAFLAKFVKQRIVQRLVQVVCKYSYAIFLVHHVIILQMVQKFDLYNISRFQSHLLFLSCCCVISFATYLLYRMNDGLLKFIAAGKKA